MTPNFIKRHYKIDLNLVANISPGFWEERNPIDQLCAKHQLDCDVVLKKLNTQINK